MKIEFNKNGAERKVLVTAVSEILETKPKYMGMPSTAYDFGGLIIDKTGALEFDDNIFPKDISDLLNKLAERGFEGECKEEPNELKQSEQSANLGLTVAIPRDKVQLANLEKILENKGELIKIALGISSLEIKEDEEKVTFPWFEKIDSEHLMTYTKFIEALCKMSITAKRINDTSKEIVNEKYAFRCFLLRLGFIGDEYKADRKILLEKLSGSSAFRNGGHKDEVSK
ncbi:TPA: virulence protein [Streptococcus equi subsp. zooepidemicus]|nr:virulence-related protein [Streptococcus phage Javan191]HEK9982061.1 virulence protein [Streptococcus equi subsp. zooepidemicus]HEL0196416.1 virulence protein [Streptococcus equi subsp. zooepidemicus]HEL0205888.1 virulence protein [Streptococcus equi subsp. zooepidemicus]HEL0531604.1 virulence protein [Streptococcus equi subsp. zooepidemicus]